MLRKYQRTSLVCLQIERLRYINFNNKKHLRLDNPSHDRLHKIRPIIDHLDKFSSVALEVNLSINKQICSVKTKHYKKQYLPKNVKGDWIFVIAGVSGYAYKFEIYSGVENLIARPNDESDRRQFVNVVVLLIQIVPFMKITAYMIWYI